MDSFFVNYGNNDNIIQQNTARSNFLARAKGSYCLLRDQELPADRARELIGSRCTCKGCSLNIVLNIGSNISDSGLSLIFLGVSVCTHIRQVEHQRCSRTGRVKENHNTLRKKHNN